MINKLIALFQNAISVIPKIDFAIPIPRWEDCEIMGRAWSFSQSQRTVESSRKQRKMVKESVFCLTTSLEYVDFDIIGYWTSSTWSL